MPNRNLSFEAVVLRARESPGGDRIVTFLAANRGLVDAFVFGGPKNRLRSLASPYHAGRVWIYQDPVKDLRKLSDFDARRTFPSLREDLRKIWAASFFAEALLRTDAAGGESRGAYDLILDGLEALETASDRDIDYAVLQYGWRLVDLMGLRPDPSGCAQCGRPFSAGEGAWFSGRQGCFFCPECGRETDAGSPSETLAVGTGALRYLETTTSLPFRDALRVAVAEEDVPTLKALVFQLARRAAEGELRTLSRAEFL